MWGPFPRACGGECAARHAAAARLRCVYLMQNTLTVVLNGIKERKVYRELWHGGHARREKKEKEDYFSSAGDKHGKTGIKNSTKS